MTESAAPETATQAETGTAEPEPPPGAEQQALPDPELGPALEAILLVVDEPVGEVLLAQTLRVGLEQVHEALISIAADYTERGSGIELRQSGGGWRLYTRERYASYVEAFVLEGQQARLTRAALETLAVVAYRQPVSRSRISGIRGVSVDGVMRTLLTRGLIRECGTEGESGASLYETTPLFLEKLGINSVAELPEIAPMLPDVDTLVEEDGR